MSGSHQPDPAPGFEPLERNSAVTDAWAPIYWRRTPEAVSIGLWLAERHCNARGFAHGGVIVALADIAMGLTLALSPGTAEVAGSLVTVSLTVDYLDSGQIGQWLELSPRLLKRGRSLGFADCVITANGKLIARSSASFKIITRALQSDSLG